MRKTLLLTGAGLLLTMNAEASMQVFQTYTAEGAGISIDALGIKDNTEGIIHANIPADARIHSAYLYSASVWDNPLADVELNGNTLVSNDSSRLDTGPKDANKAKENRWDITSIVQNTYDNFGGIYDFSVKENGSLDGEILAVIYSVASQPVNTVFLMDGELNPAGDSFSVDLKNAYDGGDVFLSLGISFGFQPPEIISLEQYTTVEIDGNLLTRYAGGQDDGYSANGGLITAGGLGDNPALPPEGNGFAIDDEYYNIKSFLLPGQDFFTITTSNPSLNDNVFFSALVINSTADIDPDPVPEPATMILLGTGLAGLLASRRARRQF